MKIWARPHAHTPLFSSPRGPISLVLVMLIFLAAAAATAARDRFVVFL